MKVLVASLVVVVLLGLASCGVLAPQCVSHGDVTISHNFGCELPWVEMEGETAEPLIGT
jgi:hypothetical protein